MANYTHRRAMMRRPQRNKRCRLPAGVYRYLRYRELVDGSVAEYLVYSTRTTERGRNIVKTFSCGRTPVPRAREQEVKRAALRYRLAWETETLMSGLRR